MKNADAALALAPRADAEIRLDALWRPYVRRWRLVTAIVAAACAVAVARAQLVLAAVPNTKTASIAGGISSLLGNAQLGGVQSTPYFITRLLMLRGVLGEVARSSAGGKETVIERVLERPAAEIRPAEVEPAMRDLLSAEVDKQTGLVTFAVTHTDSALARHVAEDVLAVASKTFVKVLRSQASDQRQAGEAQVDSARRQLRRAEAQLQEFQSTHRVYAAYASAAVERQRLEREVTAAQATYADAVSDRQGAIARELEDTPAVVVVDPIPADLVPEPRQAVLKLLLATALGLIVATAVMALRGDFTRAAPAERAQPRPTSAAAA